jgi:predicted P-loop ATPase
MGKDRIHGNSIVPLLIGAQGCGKSSFCAIILPHELRDYYNDKIDFKNETAINLGLTSFALINIDEYDSLSRTQQPLLKYLLQKSDVKMRPLYGKAYEQHRRYASFIATTNNVRPLTDPTGSRRFICVECDDIDFDETGINYEQLYAQVKQEVDCGERYFFTADERREYMHHNEAYQKVSDRTEMIKILFRPADACSPDEYMGVDEIIDLLQSRFPAFVPGRNTSVEVGRMLHRMGYKVKKTNKYNCYQIQKR